MKETPCSCRRMGFCFMPKENALCRLDIHQGDFNHAAILQGCSHLNKAITAVAFNSIEKIVNAASKIFGQSQRVITIAIAFNYYLGKNHKDFDALRCFSDFLNNAVGDCYRLFIHILGSVGLGARPNGMNQLDVIHLTFRCYF